MSFKRFFEHVAENLAKNAKHATDDVAALSKIREGALHDIESIVRGVKPADILKKEASIRADMNQVFLREQVAPEERRRIMDAIIDAAKNPKPETPPTPSSRTTRDAADPQSQSSNIINPATGRPFERTERRAGAQTSAASPSPAPVRTEGGRVDPTFGPSSQTAARTHNDGLTGNQAVDADILGGRAQRETFRIDNEKYWNSRGGDLSRISGYIENAHADPREAVKALKEIDDKFATIVKDKPYEGPQPIDPIAVIQKIRADQKVYANGRSIPAREGELPVGVEGITRAEYKAVREHVFNPFVVSMTRELRQNQWRNALTGTDFLDFHRALKETGRLVEGERPGGNLSPTKALEDLANGGKLYGKEFERIKAASSESGVIAKQEAAGVQSSAASNTGTGKFMGLVAGLGNASGKVLNFFTGPARWGASGTAATRVAAIPLLGGLVLGANSLLKDSDPDLTGFAEVRYNWGMMRSNLSETYADDVRKITNPTPVEQKLQKYLSERVTETSGKEKEAQITSAGEARVSALGAVAEGMVGGGSAQPAGSSGAVSERGASALDADLAVGKLMIDHPSEITGDAIAKLAAQMAKQGDVVTQAEYEKNVKTDPSYNALSDKMRKALDSNMSAAFAPK